VHLTAKNLIDQADRALYQAKMLDVIASVVSINKNKPPCHETSSTWKK
jgi:hypothetical protein